MNKKEAREKAREIIYLLLDSYFAVGNPQDQFGETDGDKIFKELLKIQRRFT